MAFNTSGRYVRHELSDKRAFDLLNKRITMTIELLMNFCSTAKAHVASSCFYQVTFD